VLDNGESMVDLVCHSFETDDDPDDAAEQYNYCAPGPCKPISCLPARLGGRALTVWLREHAMIALASWVCALYRAPNHPQALRLARHVAANFRVAVLRKGPQVVTAATLRCSASPVSTV